MKKLRLLYIQIFEGSARFHCLKSLSWGVALIVSLLTLLIVHWTFFFIAFIAISIFADLVLLKILHLKESDYKNPSKLKGIETLNLENFDRYNNSLLMVRGIAYLSFFVLKHLNSLETLMRLNYAFPIVYCVLIVGIAAPLLRSIYKVTLHEKI